MVERSLSMREVPGSIPGASTEFLCCSDNMLLMPGVYAMLINPNNQFLFPLLSISSSLLVELNRQLFTLFLDNGHITLKIPVLVRSLKSSNVELG